jgi:hypothetical protein
MATAIPQINYSWDFLKEFQIEAIHSVHDWQPVTRLSNRKEQVVIECGVWRNAPDNPNPIVYGCFHEPQNIMAFPWKKQEQGIDSLIYWDKTHLFLPVTKSIEISDSLTRVLDALLEQLK